MSREIEFKEMISTHLKNKLNNLLATEGDRSRDYLALANQYIYNPAEDAESGQEVNDKHYEASCEDATGVFNIERLYKNHCCAEITWNCASRCRYCLRSNYSHNKIDDENLRSIANYCRACNLNEILITGGDPFTSPINLGKLLGYIIETAPSINTIRIATRMITQAPKSIPEKLFLILESYSKIKKIEVATQINSHVEFDEDTDAVIKRIQSYGILIYSQNVFLKGVNDTPEQLIKLYKSMRDRNIEAHYLFHAIPMAHTHHLRPTVKKFIDCYSALINSGQVTGRSKPLAALMTSIGKITLLPGTILGRSEDGNSIKLKSMYRLTDRLNYNPGWKLPKEAWVDDEGYLCLSYLDGNDQ